jgi:hypothetical protein
VFVPTQEVEVTSYDDGYRGCWFAAVVKKVQGHGGIACNLNPKP